MWEVSFLKKLGSPAAWWEDQVPKRSFADGGCGELRNLAIWAHSMAVSVGAVERMHSTIATVMDKKRARTSVASTRRRVKYIVNKRYVEALNSPLHMESYDWSSDGSESSSPPPSDVDDE